MIFYHCTASKCFWWNPSSSSSSVLWPWVPSYLPNSDPLGRPAAKLPAGGRWCLCPAFLLVNCTCTGLWMSPVEKKKLWFWCYKDWILLCSSHSSMSSLPWSVHHHVCAERELENVQIALPELKLMAVLECLTLGHQLCPHGHTQNPNQKTGRRDCTEPYQNCCHFQPTGSLADFC